MFGFIWSLIVGGVIGLIAGSISKREFIGGKIGNIITGFIGSSIGNYFFGSFGPAISGFYIVPSILGAVVFLVVVSWLTGRVN